MIEEENSGIMAKEAVTDMQQDPAQQSVQEQGMNNEQPVAQDAVIPNDEQESNSIEGELVNQDVKLGPGQQSQIDAYSDNATIAVFSEKSQPAILQMLQSGKNPIDSVSSTALAVHRQLEASMQSTGEKMTEVTMAMGAAHLVSELVVLAEAADLYSLEPKDRLEAYRHSLRKYFEEGLKGGKIDPVELQKTMEPLMNKQQREYGLQQMNQRGISKTAPPPGMGRPMQGGGQGQQQGQKGMQQQQQGILGGA